MTENEVVELMKSSKSELEWDQCCDIVKKHFSGYPDWWYEKIIISGLYGRVSATWNTGEKIK